MLLKTLVSEIFDLHMQAWPVPKMPSRCQWGKTPSYSSPNGRFLMGMMMMMMMRRRRRMMVKRNHFFLGRTNFTLGNQPQNLMNVQVGWGFLLTCEYNCAFTPE